MGLATAWAIQLSILLSTRDQSQSSAETYLVVSDRQEFPEGETIPETEIVEANPEVLRICEVKDFKVWGPSGIPDGSSVTSGFIIREQSNESLNCVLAAVEEGKIFGWFASADHPHELSPIIREFQDQIAAEKNAQTH
jgi:hypothetical protein